MLPPNNRLDCKVCGNKLKELFTSLFCEFCDKQEGWFYRGYVLWTTEPEPIWEVQEHPIFRYRKDVNTWKDRQYDSDGLEIREVISFESFRWTELYASGFETAEIRMKVLTKFDRIPKTAILVGKGYKLPEGEQIYLDKDDIKRI